jgi:hypothetical protein
MTLQHIRMYLTFDLVIRGPRSPTVDFSGLFLDHTERPKSYQ